MLSGMKVALVNFAVYLSLTATATTVATRVCDPNINDTMWRQKPILNLDAFDDSVIRAEVKVEDMNYFTEYDDIHFRNIDSKLIHYFTDGKTNTVVYLYEEGVCASNQSMLQKDMHRYNYDIRLSAFSLHYVNDNTTVRGVPVDHWQYCKHSNYSRDFYFPRMDFGALINRHMQPPMRIVEKGSSIKTTTFDFIIDHQKRDMYELFSKEVNFADCIKQGGWFANTDNVPVQPESYSATVVMVFAHQKHATTRQQYYDSDTKLVSSRVLILPGSDYMKRFGHGYLTIVTDYNDGLQYVIDVDQGNCTVEPISRRSSTYAFSGPWDPASTHSPASHGLFDLSAFNLTFIAEYKVKTRDITSDVWIGSRVDWPSHGVNSSVKVFYNSEDWTTEGTDIAEIRKQMALRNGQVLVFNRQRMLRLEYHTTNEEKHLGKEIPEFTHVYDYRAGPPDFSVFDVSSCYNEPSQATKLTISVRACYDVLLRHDPRLFEAALRKFIVGVCGITPIRVNSIEVDAVGQGHVDLHIVLLDRPLVNGNVYSSSSVTLEDAVRRLGLAVDQQTDFGITVDYPEGPTTIRLIPGSLRTYGKWASSYKTGHTAGTVALIGCGMMLVGLVLTPAATYVIWKKNIAFPYLTN